MLEFLRKIVCTTFKDSVFCFSILILCYNPYAALSDFRIAVTIFVSFVAYLLIPRILNYGNDENVFNYVDFDKLLEQRETFVAALAHDLRSPSLSHIAGLQMLLNESCGVLNKEQKSIIKAILNSCKYMKELVFTLLSTYKFDCGMVNLNCSDFDASLLVEECVEDLKNLAVKKGVSIEIDHSLMCPREIFADFVQIKRVIINLLSNAINYAGIGSKVNIDIINDKGYFRFYIENSGPPLTDEMLRKLFRRYSNINSGVSKTGFGLGLYLSKQIIEAHSGYIKAESEDGKNIFSFYIPSVDISNYRSKIVF